LRRHKRKKIGNHLKLKKLNGVNYATRKRNLRFKSRKTTKEKKGYLIIRYPISEI